MTTGNIKRRWTL